MSKAENCSREDCKSPALEDSDLCFSHAPRALKEAQTAQNKREGKIKFHRVTLEFVVDAVNLEDTKQRLSETMNWRPGFKISSKLVEI